MGWNGGVKRNGMGWGRKQNVEWGRITRAGMGRAGSGLGRDETGRNAMRLVDQTCRLGVRWGGVCGSPTVCVRVAGWSVRRGEHTTCALCIRRFSHHNDRHALRLAHRWDLRAGVTSSSVTSSRLVADELATWAGRLDALPYCLARRGPAAPEPLPLHAPAAALHPQIVSGRTAHKWRPCRIQRQDAVLPAWDPTAQMRG